MQYACYETSEYANLARKKRRENNSAYPVKEREQDDLQFVPHILAVDLKIVLRVGQILSNLTQSSEVSLAGFKNIIHKRELNKVEDIHCSA